MVADVDIVNLALIKLGSPTISALTDTAKRAVTMNAIYTQNRDAELRSNAWSFALHRDSLSASTTAPAHTYDHAYPLPSDCLRLYDVDEGQEYQVEGNAILTNYDAPLKIRYVRNVSESEFDPLFVEALSCRLASAACEAITQSNSKMTRMEELHTRAIDEAVMADAIEQPPIYLDETTWLSGV